MRASNYTALALVAAAASLAGCSGGGTTPTPNTASTITIRSSSGTQAFDPNPATFGGRMVVFKNNDSVTHRVVLNDNSGDTLDIAPGQTSREVRMPNNGTNYHCTIHTGMIGSVAGVNNEPPPPCTGLYCTPGE
jgi:plastocyanin